MKTNTDKYRLSKIGNETIPGNNLWQLKAL